MTRRTWPRRCAQIVTGMLFAALAFVYVASHNGEAMFEKEWGIRHLDEIGFARRSMPGPAGLSISYFASGDPAEGRVIYVHGTPGDANNWSAYVEDPVDGMQSIAYDRPGFGRTLPSTALPSLADQARALGAFLLSPGPRAVLVGHSLGGPIVARAALDFPDRVAGLVMAAGSLDPGLERWAWYNRAADFPPIRMLLPLSLTNSNREIRPLKDELTTLGTRLGELTVPTILIHSLDDSLVPFANVAYMQRMFPPATLKDIRTFDDKDHFVIWNAAEDVRAAVRRLVVR